MDSEIECFRDEHSKELNFNNFIFQSHISFEIKVTERNECNRRKCESKVPQSCLTPSDPMDCSPPGPSVHEIFQVLEWSASPLSLGVCYSLLSEKSC